MKPIIIFSFLFLFILACKKEETHVNKDIPDWLLPKIESLENSGHCYDCSVTRITFNEEFYYHLYCGYWSCMYCQLYDKNGKLIDWANEKYSDFISKKKDEIVIWKCDGLE